MKTHFPEPRKNYTVAKIVAILALGFVLWNLLPDTHHEAVRLIIASIF